MMRQRSRQLEPAQYLPRRLAEVAVGDICICGCAFMLACGTDGPIPQAFQVSVGRRS
jgi:hypothetical protein